MLVQDAPTIRNALEQTGHTTTGDALVAALQVLEVMVRTGRTLAELSAGMPRFPQVLQNVRVAQRFAGYSLADADNLRKACGKKVREVMAKEREKFIAGCVATGYGWAGFVGELIVVAQRRGQGVGRRLLE